MKMNNYYKTLVFFSGLGSFLLCLSSYSHAATWSEVSYNLSQNATAINACLTTETSEYQSRNPATSLEGQEMAVEALENANACLEPIFQSLLDDVEINFRFRNPSFRNEIAIEGEFSVDLENLLQSSSISSNFLNKFTINNTECDLSNLNPFSYETKPSSLELLKLEYAITIIDKVLKQNPSNESISLLRSSLDELTSNSQELSRMASQLDAIAANAQQRLAQQLLGFEIPSQVSSSTSPLLSSYSASDSSPQLNFICQFDAGSFSVTTENGITDVLLVQQGNSNRNGFGFSFSRGNSTISYRLGSSTQSLEIKTRRRNNRVETTYQGLSFIVYQGLSFTGVRSSSP